MKSLDTPLCSRKTTGMRRSIYLIASLLALAGLAPLAAQDTGLAAAVHGGSPQQVREAIARGGDPNGRLPDGETPLADAATSNNDPGVIAALLRAGAQVDATDATGMTPLMWAAAENANPDVTAALLTAGADVNARNVVGITPLMFAAKENSNPAVAQKLLSAGAGVNARDINGMTALLYAARNNDSPALIAELLDAGADARLASAGGTAALAYAQANPALKGTTAPAALERGALKSGSAPASAPALTSLPTPASAPAPAAIRSPAAAATSDGQLVIDIKPVVRTTADVWIALSGPDRQHFYRTASRAPVIADLKPGTYQVHAAFANDSGIGYSGTATLTAGEQSTLTIPLAYSRAYMASLGERYDSLSQRLYRDRQVTLPALESERVVKGRRGLVVDGLGLATAGMAGVFAYLSASDPGSPPIYHGAALAGGAFSAVLLVWGTSLLITRPSLDEIARLKAADRKLDAQLAKLALIRNSSSR